MIKTIDPQEWHEFLADFSTRNRGRRARFEAFNSDGVAEEDEEAIFEKIEIEKDIVTVTRTGDLWANVEVPGIHGISVQYDTDDSENTLEFMNTNGDMTVLHFESKVDGDS